MAYLGTILGQLTFGFFVDRYGRKYGTPALIGFFSFDARPRD